MDSDDDGYEPNIDEHYDFEEVEPAFTESEKLESKHQLDLQIKLKNEVPEGIQLFLDSDDKTEEARSKYGELPKCKYQNKQLGESGQEPMTCVCNEDWNGEINHACEDEDCINRGTKVECISGEGSCGDDCSNQRFQKKQYAPVTVIKTEKKGYGLRADGVLDADVLIYEYIGEVIDEDTFKKRMLEYDHLKIKHFYFMMLQKGEFIDATRRGSLGRFCNHSCNPNCYVEKWVVGNKLRMGIFSKRRIVEGEELTFNYNVDRYGANPQPCYCGERNCIGFIGGKTQTDAASLLPQSISNALGSSVEAEQEFFKLMKAKGEKVTKSENNINVEFVKSLEMKGIDAIHVGTVMGALLQTEDLFIAEKLVERLELSSEAVLSKVKNVHGFAAFGRLFKFAYDSSDKSWFEVNDSLVIRLLKIMTEWVVSKNYLQEKKITQIVDTLIKVTKSDEIRQLCEEMKEKWSTFKENMRIAKSDKVRAQVKALTGRDRSQEARDDTPRVDDDTEPWRRNHWQMGWYATRDDTGKVYYYNASLGESSWDEPLLVTKTKEEQLEQHLYKQNKHKEMREREKKEEEYKKSLQKKKEQNELNKIIENARRAELQKQAKLKEEQELEEKKRLKKEQYKLKRLQGNAYTQEEFEKRWKRYFAQEVPNMLKKYLEEIGVDNVKRCGKDITQSLVSKEYSKDSSKKPPNDQMPSDKRKKVKMFIEGYMEKFLVRFREKSSKRKLDLKEDPRKKVHSS